MTNEEKDIHLAELADEHVHKWKEGVFPTSRYSSTMEQGNGCICGVFKNFGVSIPPAATPRAHSTDELLDYAVEHEIEIDVHFDESGTVIEDIDGHGDCGILANTEDHDSTGHARRHMLYQAIVKAMEVKK